MIDLRSDTITRPTPAMRELMAGADVGDDVYGDDPTVRALEERTAAILGKEAAVFMPTGTMTNQVALRCHTEAGDAILADIGAHVYTSEGGAPAGLSGLLVRPLLGVHGIFTAEDVRGAVWRKHAFSPSTIEAPTKLLCVENTHNGGGGTVWPHPTLTEVAATAGELGLRLHLDGARLWNASVASGVSEAELAAPFDTVSVCFSKGLGAPMGSALACSGALIGRARRFKQMFGGGFRQAGVVAAAALHALEHERDRLADDHVKARRLATLVSELPGIDLDLERVQTNILRFRVTTMNAGELVDRCHARGVYLLPAGAQQVRAVLHRDVAPDEVERAALTIRDALEGT